MFQIDDIREKNVEVFYDIYLNGGKIKLVEAIAEGLGKRTYFTINKDGEIKRKDLNQALYFITQITKDNYKEVIKAVLEEMVDLREREIIKKIDRFSKSELNSLTKNFNKVLASGERSYVLKYGKELFLRDRNLFFTMLFDYVLLENISNKKSVMAWSLYELFKGETEFSDEVFYVAMSYIAQKRSEFSDYENILCGGELKELDKKELAKNIEEKSNNKVSVEVACYSKILNKFTYTKENIYANLLANKL